MSGYGAHIYNQCLSSLRGSTHSLSAWRLPGRTGREVGPRTDEPCLRRTLNRSEGDGQGRAYGFG
jgi:hypothetical protein